MNEPESDGIDPLYISDIETYDLLYINEPGRELFGVSSDEDIVNFKCYEFLQHHDSLTGLLNRSRYIQDLDGLAERNQPIGVIILDINGMKEVDDRDGHAVGDRLLIECANAMRSVLADLFSLYRIGGDEFVAIAVGVAETDFSRLSAELGRTFEDGSLCRAAIGARWEEHPKNIPRTSRRCCSMPMRRCTATSACSTARQRAAFMVRDVLGLKANGANMVLACRSAAAMRFALIERSWMDAG